MTSKPKDSKPPGGSEQIQDPGVDQTLKEFEKLVADLAQPNYLFRLYVSGTSARSMLAIANVRRIGDQYLPGHYELEVIDVYQRPAETKTALLERTAELTASNKELEAFSYSVSHDLRAPLRHIDGFSRMLLERYSAQLDAKGQHYLEEVRAGAQKMARLVDDLLALSRVGRQELRLQVTGLNSLFEEARIELMKDTGDRHIEWKIAALPFVACDPTLMRQVVTNLLSNAVKYTRPRERAVIEVGQMHD